MSHESPHITDPCVYRVTHVACGWSILTYDWQVLAHDHSKDCEAEDPENVDYDYRVQCLLHNPDNDETQARVVGRD